MRRKQVVLLLVIIELVCAGLCLGAAVTSSPYTGAGWNTGAPNDEAIGGNAYLELQDLRKGIAIRMDKEHVACGSSSAGGEHIPGGCAVLYYDTTTALDANVAASTFVHDGLLYDTTLLQFFTMNAAEDTKVAIEIGTAGIADANVTTAKIADANITAAKMAADSVLTASIADANITTAKIADSNITTAKIADANVTVAKMLCKDEDDMVSDSDTYVATQQSIKAYVDDQVTTALPDDDAFGSWASKSNDTEYTAASDGIVCAYNISNAEVKGQTPTGTQRIRCPDGGDGYSGITMPVRKGDTWKVTGASTVYWLPIGG